ncbi:MAG: tetratricopeptide repeat protein [Bacteroidota bacterium]|nr:tetratricopeptide repeat protein [Bacteroidota bacterium]
MNRFALFRSLFITLLALTLTMLYIGCASSQQAASEDEMVTDTGTKTQADTTAVATEQSAVTTQPAAQPEGPTNEQLRSELDSLKTENVQLQAKVSSSEQANRDLTTKVSDLEAANMAMKSQAETKKPAGKHHAVKAGKSSSDEIQAYEAAIAKFKSKNYTEAVGEFQTLLNTGIKEDYADNCHYWIGLSSYQMKDYKTAIEHFNQVFSYRFSEKKDDAQIMIAQCYEKLGEREKAMAEYKKLVEMYPTSEYVKRAQSKLR